MCVSSRGPVWLSSREDVLHEDVSGEVPEAGELTTWRGPEKEDTAASTVSTYHLPTTINHLPTTSTNQTHTPRLFGKLTVRNSAQVPLTQTSSLTLLSQVHKRNPIYHILILSLFLPQLSPRAQVRDE